MRGHPAAVRDTAKAVSLLAGVAGLFVAPVLTTAYMLADKAAAPDSKTQAGALVNTAFNTGNALGSASIGLLLGRLTLAAAFAVGALPSLLGALAGMRSAPRPEEPTERDASPHDVSDPPTASPTRGGD
ncbi:MFS transporter [Microbispora bryophytorum]